MIHDDTKAYDITRASNEIGVAPERLLEIIIKTFTMYEEEMKSLKEAIESQSFENIYQHSHKLKGSFSTLLFYEAEKLAAQIEEGADENCEIDYLKLYDDLKRELGKLRRFLKI